MMVKCKHCDTVFDRGDTQRRLCQKGYCRVARRMKYLEERMN